MTVYVDDMWRRAMGRFGRMKMSHMAADTTEELLAMADRIGLDRRYLQSPGGWDEHFDVSLSKRAEAIRAGAVEVTMRDMVRGMRVKRGLGR